MALVERRCHLTYGCSDHGAGVSQDSVCCSWKGPDLARARGGPSRKAHGVSLEGHSTSWGLRGGDWDNRQELGRGEGEEGSEPLWVAPSRTASPSLNPHNAGGEFIAV